MEAAAPPLRRLRDRFSALVLEGALVPADLPAAYAAAVDRWLAEVFAGVVGETPRGFALLAVGGYGRGELCPGSDLDLTLIHQRRRDVRAVADRIWYSLWDAGLRLDHSVRTPKEALSLAREDLRALLGLLDGRVVAGDPELAGALLGSVDEWWRTHAPELLPGLDAAGRERHARFGELPFLLEPHLKESAGGLRDLEVLALLARAEPPLAPLLRPASLEAQHRLLLGARVCLHARTGSAGDRLLLQEQDGIAPMLGYEDADALMAAMAAAGRAVIWAGADGWRRTVSFLAGPRGRAHGGELELGEGVVLRDGELALAPGAPGLEDGSALLRLATASAEYGRSISPSALGKLEAGAPSPPEPWSSALRQSFLSLLEYGWAAIGVLETLDQYHLLERLLPEWLEVRNRPQRNAYHRFTVDRHLLESAAQAARLVRSVSRPDLLLVASLLHDIGKGMPGDHSEAGRQVAVRIATRMGFPSGDVEVIARLVLHHLLLADTATRRDLDDPATVTAVAAAAGDRLTLELLAALTEADSLATGPTAWSPWKAGLVAALTAAADALLAGAPPAQGGPASFPTSHHLELAASGSLQVVLEDGTLTVVAADRPGLLSLVAGTLALHRLDIRSAVVGEAGTMAVQVFEVSPAPGEKGPDAGRLRDDLSQALAGELLLSARLADLERAYARSRRPATARPSEVRVLVHEEASSFATVVEVRAPDSRGLLHRLTRSLAESGLDVVSARLSTIGHEVVDAFYVRESSTGERPGRDRLEPALERLAAEAAPPTA